ncbi:MULTISPECIES: hypothetical protein [Paenibacillaceae]|uniref:Uncharacterized protein n=1 Tax=Aneurinibacillus danicus TaxID=267746 RepID=A0A511V863_9BACL|nr:MULTISPECIES: hypothetical protein [Paenibacillaceae]PZM65728.1 hypothetical protein DOE73_10495 [Paenibacillus dendritiformis]GEN33873.1 hypothetical protein ADA01nite_13330 [Aneurinibacillus danicus]
MNIDIGIYDTTLIPAMIFILWIVGQAGVQKRFLPLVALVLGIVLGLIFIGTTPEGAVAGVLLAATAIGFHSGSKNVLQALQKPPAGTEDLIGEQIQIPGLDGWYEVTSVEADGTLKVKQVTADQ